MVVWSAVVIAILSVPLIAMQFTDEVAWGIGDFAFAGALLLGAGFAYELAARTSINVAYRVAVGVALAAAFLLTWINLAVGIIGSDDNPANLMYWGVLAIAVIGVLLSRYEPRAMARAMFATAAAQALVAAIALSSGYVTFVLTGFFVAMWLISASLFSKAAREQSGEVADSGAE
ncbi:MAG: hypothetical protein KJO98_12030 [Rhodothermia bacterium]|nr:hypothetical protein [Rhodothermia bacterium]